MENASEDENQVAQFFKDNFPGLSSVDFHWVYNYQGEIQEGNMEIYERLPYENFPCCVFPWSSITFCHDGKVSYCFVEPRENRFMGDITTHTFEEIWNGEEYALFRRMMAQKQFGEMANDGFFCQKCSWLWSMQSQSPRNLTLGYSANNGDLLQNKSFGNIMDLPMEDIITHGMDLYLRGEIHQAAGIFNTLASFALTPEMHDIINRMINLCNRVFHKYKDLPLWQDMLQKEGKSHEDRTCRYYPIA
jgi:radical SAM protein with 4Fe4S-binding SPASM domain